jgi:hypothetical protein
MDWQQVVSLCIVAIAALLFVRGWTRRKRDSRVQCSSACACPEPSSTVEPPGIHLQR